MSLSREDAASILKQYDELFNELVSLRRWPTSISPTKSYTVVYNDAHEKTSTLVIITGSTEALHAQTSLLETITSNTSLPVPHLLHRSPDPSSISSPYILLTQPSPANIPLSTPSLPAHARASAELSLGAHLQTLHSRVQNDWFGVPGEEKEWGECYSWQEAFSLLVENALGEIEERGLLGGTDGEGPEIPVEVLRHALGRAIGFFLFDDVEVPSLIWYPSPSFLAHAFISSPSDSASASALPQDLPTIPSPDPLTALTNFTTSLWGDPLLDGAFHSPGPSAAFLEGYGGNPVVFPRQNTKRLWYTAYAALRALLAAADEDEEDARKSGKEARDTLREVAQKLKDAPCY